MLVVVSSTVVLVLVVVVAAAVVSNKLSVSLPASEQSIRVRASEKTPGPDNETECTYAVTLYTTKPLLTRLSPYSLSYPDSISLDPYVFTLPSIRRA